MNREQERNRSRTANGHRRQHASFEPRLLQCFDWIWLNGQLFPFDHVHLLYDVHALHYATSAFEGIRAYRQPDGRLGIWMLPEHINRLQLSATAGALEVPFSGAEIIEGVRDVLALNDDRTSPTMYIRPLVHIGGSPEPGIGQRRRKNIGVMPAHLSFSVVVMTEPWGAYLPPSSFFQGGATVYVSSLARMLPVQAQTLKQAGHYGLTSFPIKRRAVALGATEGAAVNLSGEILDGTGQTICLILEDIPGQWTLATVDPVQGNILKGETLKFVFGELCGLRGLRYSVRFVDRLSWEMVNAARGMMFLGTATEVTPITRLVFDDDAGVNRYQVVGNGFPHPLAITMQQIYQQAVRGEIPECRRYITTVPDRDHVLSRLFSKQHAQEK